MATQPTPKPTDPSFLDTLRREAGAFGSAVNPINLISGAYHAAADPARAGEDADFENKIGPTGRLIDRAILQPTVNAVKDYAGGKVSIDDALQNAPEALGGGGAATVLGRIAKSAGGAAATETAPVKPTLSPSGEIAWPESYKNPPAGGGGNYTATDLTALKQRMGLDNAPSEMPQTLRDATGLERRVQARPQVMNASELEEAIRNRKPAMTPFDMTQGAMDTIKNDPFMPKHPSEMMQGGHAGGGVASVEELSRPGSNYVVGKQGALTYHGKSFAPESTPIGSAHVTVMPDGNFRVNEGNLTPTMSNALRMGLTK